jgi:hypothetical protein
MLNKMKLQVQQQQEDDDLDALPPVPDENKLQTFLRRLRIKHFDEGLRIAGRNFTPEDVMEYAEKHGRDSMDRNSVGNSILFIKL